MILKSITLSGFKSFAKKTTIDVSQRVTGIVGPNGSGKSNIAEAIRFVLGEQSMKSIRSKSLGDLVFKGSSAIHALGRASVSLTIDNSKKVYNDNVAPEISKFLAYDEIVLSREVFVDGGSTYKINDAEVRLKDVQSLLSLAGIGASVHTIISQGEADKILLSSPKERKEMIEDALGLRIHQIRLRESERKLLKVKEHMNTTELLRREIAPELRHLSSLMQKLGKVEDERVCLLENYKKYFKFEDEFIKELKAKLIDQGDLNIKISEIRQKLEDLNKKELDINSVSNKTEEKAKLNQEKAEKQEERFSLEREISNVLFEKRNLLSKINNEVKTLSIDKSVFISFKENINTNLDSVKKLLNQGDIVTAHNIIDSNSWNSESINKDKLESEITTLESKESELNTKISNIKNIILNIDQKLEDLNKEKITELQNIYKDKNEAERSLRDLENKIENIATHKGDMETRENDFIFTTTEAQKFVGHDVMNYGFVDMAGYDHSQNIRSIERSKIRIEEVGIINGGEIKNNFEEMSDRDKFLANELEDLTRSQESLDTLIASLVTTIDNDFKKGVEKINFTFSNFFHDIFPGGRAKLFNVESVDEEGGIESVSGIDIEVSLPDKKIKDINMLSGGEKTLCSIAHNRETMNECDILYGVTMGFDGCSKMLSIKFDK